MQKGITGPIGKLDETKSLVGIVPFDDGLDGGPEGASNLWPSNCGVDPKLSRVA
jgi:hypothetical protein